MYLTKQFFKYVSQNIFGLLGTSCYILADTYFISQAAGADGVTLLNLCLPVYNFIFAVGSMVGLGAATRYAILKAQGDERCQRYFSNAIFCACVLSVPFLLVGIFAPGGLLRLMGGDAGIMALGIPYARIFLMFTPFFMCNYIVSSFVRNDGDPSLAMVATLSSSLFNVVFDYIFMFPMGLGLAGAALATAVSPIISISICSRHFFKKENGVEFVHRVPSVKLLGQSCQLGISGFVGEMSSGVTTTVFNFLLLGLAGNVAVAAYGVVANFALVATAIFNGVAQGAQPLVSECYGKSDKANLSPEDKAVYSKYVEELSLLSLQFGKNVLTSSNAYQLHLADSADLAGLPDYVKEIGAMTAKERGLDGWVFTLDYPSYLPFMQNSTRPDLRKQMFMAYNSKAVGGDNDNTGNVRKIADLRIKIANILGY